MAFVSTFIERSISIARCHVDMLTRILKRESKDVMDEQTESLATLHAETERVFGNRPEDCPAT